MAGELERQVDPPQTIPTYMPNGKFVGFLAPDAYQAFMQQMGNGNNGGGGGGRGGDGNWGNLLGLGSDSALAAYQLFTIGQLDSDFDSAKAARRKRNNSKAALIASAKIQSTDLSAKLKTFLDADDDMSFYQNRVIDGQLKGFWASALAAGGRALGDLVGGGGGNGGSGEVSGWIMAAGGAFLLATLFDRDDDSRRRNRNDD